MTHRVCIGRNGIVERILEDMGIDNSQLMQRRHSGHDREVDIFIDTTTAHTWQVGDAYDAKQLNVDDLVENESVLWTILLDMHNRLRALQGATFDQTSDEFNQYVRLLLGA